jgi:hypothetical protein
MLLKALSMLDLSEDCRSVPWGWERTASKWADDGGKESTARIDGCSF